MGEGGKKECRERVALLDKSEQSINFEFQLNKEYFFLV